MKTTPAESGGTEHRPLFGYGLVLLAAACWASGGLTAKWLFTAPSAATAGWPVAPLGIGIAPTTLSGARALSAFVLLLAWLLVARRGVRWPAAKELPFVAVFGVVGLAGVHFTYFKTISLTSVATAILLQYLAPIVVVLVGVVFLRHKMSWAVPVGVVLSVTGCALVVGAIGGTGLVVSGQGVMWGLISAVFFASYSLMGAVAAPRFDPQVLLAGGLGFAALFWVVVLGPAAVLEPFTRVPTALAILFVAVVSTIVPFSAFLTALHHIPPANATITATVEPVLAGIGAFALLGERMDATQLLGGLLVLCAIVVVERMGGSTGPTLPPAD